MESFAKKFECSDLVMNEYRRRAESDYNSTDLYRYAPDAAGTIFALSCEAGIINVEKYNPIPNRWELYRNITVADLVRKRVSFGLIYGKNIIVLIGGKENVTYLRKVNYLLSVIPLANYDTIMQFNLLSNSNFARLIHTSSIRWSC